MSFDEIAKTWDNDPTKVERAAILAERINALVQLPPKARALEFGCGTGLLSFHMKHILHHITLADTSVGMLDVLRSKISDGNISNMSPLHIDMLTETFNEPPFDIIYTLLTLHHVHDIDKLMHVFAENLNKGGYLCIADLITEDGSFHSSDPHFDGHLGFSQEQMTQFYTSAGFEITHFEIYHTIARPTPEGVKTFPVFLIIGKKA